MKIQGISIKQIYGVQTFPTYLIFIDDRTPIESTKEEVERIINFWDLREKAKAGR